MCGSALGSLIGIFGSLMSGMMGGDRGGSSASAPAPLQVYNPGDNANNGSKSITVTTPDPALSEPELANAEDASRATTGGKQGMTVTPNRQRNLGVVGNQRRVQGGGVNIAG